jgi:hypothetical protein
MKPAQKRKCSRKARSHGVPRPSRKSYRSDVSDAQWRYLITYRLRTVGDQWLIDDVENLCELHLSHGVVVLRLGLTADGVLA